MKKSSRHSKIAGDFAETLVLYWLSKFGYECARVDHTGIDLIARDPQLERPLGISVKCRSRYDGTEHSHVNLPPDGFTKAEVACNAFQCDPYYAIVVDGAGTIRGFLLPMSRLLDIAGGTNTGMRYWKMGKKDLLDYAIDPTIKRFELGITACSWR